MTALLPPQIHAIERTELLSRVTDLLTGGARLAMVSAHHEADAVRIVYSFLTPGEPAVELQVVAPDHDLTVPTLSRLSFPAGRFEREVRDLFGVTPVDHPLPRRLVRHGHWPVGYYPMRHDAPENPEFGADVGSFPFVEVEGRGVYEIPVGPVHAGMIEPGHFRFSVVGETVLRLKARLWFVHRGVEKLFEGQPPDEGVALAERISGDTAVGHSLAYCTAVEQALGIECTPTDRRLRSLLLELERLYNHVNDIGAIVNDVGYGVIHVHTGVLREKLLRHNKHVTGHRLLRGAIRPGGTLVRHLPDPSFIDDIARELREIVEIALGNHGAVERLTGTSALSAEDAARIGTLGYVARASGLDLDARRDHPLGPNLPTVTPVVERSGDVLARFLVRAREATQSASLISQLVQGLGTGSPTPAPARATMGHGLGVVEAWRGTLCHRVEIAGGLIRRVKVVDPSFFNWPAVPVAMQDTIVPDFPLTNKSFNQSYAGNDL